MKASTHSPKRLKSPLYRSIATRPLLSVLSGALLGLGGMSVWVYQALNAQAKHEIQKTLDTEVEQVEKQIVQVEKYVAGIGAAHSHKR